MSCRRPREDPEESDGRGKRDQASEAGDKETALLLARREGEIRDVTAASGEGQGVKEIQQESCSQPGTRSGQANCFEGKWAAVLTPLGIRRFGVGGQQHSCTPT